VIRPDGTTARLAIPVKVRLTRAMLEGNPFYVLDELIRVVDSQLTQALERSRLSYTAMAGEREETKSSPTSVAIPLQQSTGPVVSGLTLPSARNVQDVAGEEVAAHKSTVM